MENQAWGVVLFISIILAIIVTRVSVFLMVREGKIIRFKNAFISSGFPAPTVSRITLKQLLTCDMGVTVNFSNLTEEQAKVLMRFLKKMILE